MPAKTSRRKYRGNVGFVGTFVFGESGVSVDAMQAGARCRLKFWREPQEVLGEGCYKFLHWLLDAYLVLCLVREEPTAVVVPFKLPQEAESCCRKGREMWADHPSIVDICRIAV